MIESLDNPSDVDRALDRARQQLQLFEESVDRKRLLERMQAASPAHPVLLARAAFLVFTVLPVVLALFAILAPFALSAIGASGQGWAVEANRELAKLDEVVPVPDGVPGIPTMFMVVAVCMFVGWVTTTFAALAIGRETSMMPWEAREHQKLVNEITRLTTQKSVIARINNQNAPRGGRPAVGTPVPLSLRDRGGVAPAASAIGSSLVGGAGFARAAPAAPPPSTGGLRGPAEVPPPPHPTYGGTLSGANRGGSGERTASQIDTPGHGLLSRLGGSEPQGSSARLGSGGASGERRGALGLGRSPGDGNGLQPSPSLGRAPGGARPNGSTSTPLVRFGNHAAPAPSPVSGLGAAPTSGAARPLGTRSTIGDPPAAGGTPLGLPQRTGRPLGSRARQTESSLSVPPAGFPSTPTGPPPRRDGALGGGSSFDLFGSEEPSRAPAAPTQNSLRVPTRAQRVPATDKAAVLPDIVEDSPYIAGAEDPDARARASKITTRLPRWGRIDEPWLEEVIQKAEALALEFPAQAHLEFSQEEHLPFTLVIARATPAMAVRCMVSYVDFLGGIPTPPLARIELVNVPHLDRNFYRNVKAALDPHFQESVQVEPEPGRIDVTFLAADPSWQSFPRLPMK